MTKTFITFQIFFLWTISVFGQTNSENAYLVRKHIDKDSTWIVDNSECFYISKAGLKENQFGWLQYKELKDKQCDFLYFEANTFGSMQIGIEINVDTKQIKLDTLSAKSYKLINHHYGNLRRDFEDKNNTIDFISGNLNFDKISDNEIIVDGIINIDTKKPITHQEILFKKVKMKIQTLSEILNIEKLQELEKEKQEKKMFGAYELVSNERIKFYDSIFNLRKYPKNNIKAILNNKTKFDFQLDNSFVLVNASLTDSAKQDLTELLGGNILTTVQGNKNVFTLHSFYDPEKNSIDDETNYSLNLEFDSISVGTTYKLDNRNKRQVAKLAFWHYGPNGTVITSINVKGTITINQDNQTKTVGYLNLIFKNNDKSTLILIGDFELPKLKLSDISKMEENIKIKLKKYYEEE